MFALVIRNLLNPHTTGAVMKIFLLILTAMAIFSGCTPKLSPQVAAITRQIPAEFPEAYYLQGEAAGQKIFRVIPGRSRVIIVVRRAGALARLGHDHVVASHDAGGYVDVDAGRADLYVALARLTVDESGLRAEAGLSTQPSPEAVEGTRRNMLEKVLDAERFPFALIRAKRSSADSPVLQVTLTLHGTSKTFEVPAQIENLVDGFRINGQMAFNQTDFGMTPFSVLGGAIQVQDRLDLRFVIFAKRD
jgi:hypothetical protein